MSAKPPNFHSIQSVNSMPAPCGLFFARVCHYQMNLLKYPQASFVLTDDFMQRPAGVKVWDGQAWVPRTASVWSGQAWVERPVLVWGGQAWASPAG